MDQKVTDLAEHLLRVGFDDLPERERRVISQIAKRVHISRNINSAFEERLAFGQRLADRMSAFGGSWTFIILFGVVLVVWVLLNSLVLAQSHDAFDPYPYVFLNLVLSMLAALQAPVIMMSQNRQAAKDRLMAGNDYEVNLKAELEIMRLHEKLDQLRQEQLTRLIERQEEQLRLIEQMIKE
jgi:uncharacterized membrane protein